MARALVRHGVVKACERRGGGGGDGYLFPMPKNASKASMLVHLVHFNKQQHTCRPHSFCLAFVEDLAILVQIHSMLPPQVVFGQYLPVPLKRSVFEGIGQPAGSGFGRSRIGSMSY